MKQKILAFLATVGVFIAAILVGTTETQYNKVVKCFDVYQENNLYITAFIDSNSNVWEWESAEKEFEIGVTYILKMSDNHTSNIMDDFIINIEKK